MISIALKKITTVDPRIGKIPKQELRLKLAAIYDMGYIYNPYEKKFYNPFIEKSFKAIIIQQHTIEEFYKKHLKAQNYFIKKHGSVKNFREIARELYSRETPREITEFLESMSGIIALLLLALSLLFYINSSLASVVGTGFGALVFLYYYVVHNHLFSKYEQEHLLSSFWRKTKYIFYLLVAFSFIYCYYLLSFSLHNHWAALVSVIMLELSIRIFTKNKLSLEYQKMMGINHVREFAEKNGFF